MAFSLVRLFAFISCSALALSAGAFLTASPTWISYGSVEINGFRSGPTVWVQNNSDDAVDVSISDSCIGDFNIQKYACWRRLQPHESCTISNSFQPHFEGYHSCSLNLYASQGGSVQISFSGQGVRQATAGN